MPRSIEGKVVLITGCSSGFGLHIASHLSSRGCRVIATMRDSGKKSALLSEVQRRGGLVDILPLDVTDKPSIRKVITEIAVKYGFVDVLVNNAGLGIAGFFEDLSDADIRQAMEVNFFGVQNVTRQVIPLMRQRKKGKIINVSSVSGFSTSPAFGAYNASKWALEAFSESLRYEMKLFGIDVLLIEPGVYRTKIFSENAHYAQDFDNPESPYYSFSQGMREIMMEYVEDCHKDIEEVSLLVEKLIRAANPSFRNIPDIEGKCLYALRKVLPFRVYSWIIQKAVYGRLKSLQRSSFTQNKNLKYNGKVTV